MSFEFIKKYRYLFIAIIIIILLWLLCKTKSSNYEYEHLSASETTSNLSLTNLLNKPIHLRYDANPGQTYYLGVSHKNMCGRLSTAPGECLNNVALLQTVKNDFSLFTLIQNPTNNTYLLSTTLGDKNFYLNKKNYVPGSNNYICFDNGSAEETQLEIDSNNSGQIRLKFKVQVSTSTAGLPIYQSLYVTSCINSLCNQGTTNLPRLCLTVEPPKAIYFTIEPTPEKLSEESSQEGMETNKAIYNEEGSASSLSNLSSLTSGATVVINGVEENMLQGVEKFMSI